MFEYFMKLQHPSCHYCSIDVLIISRGPMARLTTPAARKLWKGITAIKAEYPIQLPLTE
jgi:hypothetical protein